MKVSLTVEVGDTKHSLDIDMEDEISEIERLTILSQVLKAVAIEKDLAGMIDDYITIGQAYKEFFKEVDNIEPSDREPLELDLRYNEDIITNKLHASNDQPDYYKTGIIEEGGIKKYKCRMHCECGNNQNLYISKDSKKVECPKCGKVHQKRDAKKQGFPARDKWGNYFIAGNFIGEDEIGTEES